MPFSPVTRSSVSSWNKTRTPSLVILTSVVNDDIINELLSFNAYEICPEGKDVNTNSVKKWHSFGLNVRAWGIYNEDIMKSVYDAGANGMTVNFPDKLLKYINKK